MQKTIFIFYLQIKQKNGERQTAFPQTFKPFLGGFYYFSLQKTEFTRITAKILTHTII